MTRDAQQQVADFLKCCHFTETLSAVALGSVGGVTCHFHCNFGSFALTLGPHLPKQSSTVPLLPAGTAACGQVFTGDSQPVRQSCWWDRVPVWSKTYTE